MVEELEVALQQAMQSIADAPGDDHARQRAADLLARLGRPRAAIAQYQMLVGKYASEGRPLRALAVCHRILQLDPDHAETQSTLADLFADRATPRDRVRMPSDMCGAIEGARGSRMIDVEKLARIPLFSELERAAFLLLINRLRRLTIAAGSAIVNEGEPGDSMFVIAQGAVRVVRRTGEGHAVRVLDEMGEGEFFGEMALVSHGPRLATVTALTDTELLEVRREQLDAMVAKHARMGDVIQRFYKERLLAHVLAASPIFRLLPEPLTRTLIDVFHIHTYPSGTTILTQGEPGRGLFVLLRGRCDVFNRRSDGVEEAYPSMMEGDVFGELSLLYGGRATATVRCTTACVVLELQKQWFDELLLGHPEVRQRIYALAGERIQRTRDLLAREELERRLV